MFRFENGINLRKSWEIKCFTKIFITLGQRLTHAWFAVVEPSVHLFNTISMESSAVGIHHCPTETRTPDEQLWMESRG